MSLKIYREHYSAFVDDTTGKRKVTGHEDITDDCQLFPFHDYNLQDRKRVVFAAGNRQKECNVGVKYVNGPFKDCWEAQPGYVFKGVELKRNREEMLTEAEIITQAQATDLSEGEALESLNDKPNESPDGELLSNE